MFVNGPPSILEVEGKQFGILQFELKFDLLTLVLRHIETFGIFPFDDSVLGRFRHVVAGADMVALPVVNLDLDESARGKAVVSWIRKTTATTVTLLSIPL